MRPAEGFAFADRERREARDAVGDEEVGAREDVEVDSRRAARTMRTPARQRIANFLTVVAMIRADEPVRKAPKESVALWIARIASAGPGMHMPSVMTSPGSRIADWT
ncbi:MAG TPA: hypothetical protein VEC19_00705 [Usitatibacter sp.]|nr:hypothetical protein [Usitatibacter sp.]